MPSWSSHVEPMGAGGFTLLASLRSRFRLLFFPIGTLVLWFPQPVRRRTMSISGERSESRLMQLFGDEAHQATCPTGTFASLSGSFAPDASS